MPADSCDLSQTPSHPSETVQASVCDLSKTPRMTKFHIETLDAVGFEGSMAGLLAFDAGPRRTISDTTLN